MALKIVCDHAQRRLLRDRMVIAAAGMELAGELDGAAFADTWLEPITGSLILRPRPLYDAWYQQDAGAYAKLGLADFELGAEWEERLHQSGRGPWLARAAGPPAGAPAGGRTVATYPADCGFWVAWFAYGSGELRPLLRCGWNDTVSPEAGVALVFWSDGTAEVRRGGITVGYGRVTGARGGDVRAAQVFQVMLIPLRGRELVVWSHFGNGFRHIFDNLTIGEPIVPAGRFWFDVPSGAAQVQVAPLRYPTTGFASTVKASWAEPPDAGEIPDLGHRVAWLSGGAITASLTDWSGSAFLPDGEAKQCRVRVDLAAANEFSTPCLAGLAAAFPATFATTADEPQTITQWVTEATLSVPDDPAGVTLDLALRDLEGRLTDRDWRVGRRPIKAEIDDLPWFEGNVVGVTQTDGPTDGARHVRWEARDPMQALEEVRFREPTPFDGRPFAEVIAELAAHSGVATATVSETDLMIASGDAWSVIAEVGDSVAEWIGRLMETFAADWWYGFRPAAGGLEFFALAPDDLPQEPALTLYRSKDDGENVYREWREEWLEPAANEVRVIGFDPVTERPLEAVKRDAASADPATPPEERPANWLGVTRRFTLVDPALTTVSAAEQACQPIFAEMCRVRQLAEFHADALLASDGRPLWRGDAVHIAGKGIYRIVSFGCRFVREDENHWREAVYVAERFGDELEEA